MNSQVEVPKKWETEIEFTLPMVAEILGIHRVTLLRMHQTGRVPEPRWKRDPDRRVYNLGEIRAIHKAVYDRTKEEKRNYVD